MDETTMPDPGGGRPHATHRRPVVPVAIVAVTALLIAAVLWLAPGDGQDEVATDPSAGDAEARGTSGVPFVVKYQPAFVATRSVLLPR